MHSFIYSTDFCLPHSTQIALAKIINAIYFLNPVDAFQLQLYRLLLLHLTVAIISFFLNSTASVSVIFSSPLWHSFLSLSDGLVYELVPYRVKLKAKRWRIDDFELWSWRRLLRVPWTARRSSQSILKSILNIHWKNWCWSSSTLATWCKEPTHWKRPQWGERLKVKGEGGGRGWDG